MFNTSVSSVSQETPHFVHIDKQNQTNDKMSTTTNPQADAKGITTAEVNTYCSFKGRPRSHILLATAMVEIRNKSGQYVQCRALLDSASQSHFITERCVQRLKLSRTQTHSYIQGISNVNTATHYSVSIHLRSRHMTLDCAVLSNITGTTPCDQAGGHVLATTQFYKKQLLAGHFLVGHQLSHRMTHNAHSCCEKTTV